MLVDSSLMFAQAETQYNAPGYFQLVFLSLLALGAIGWLVAAVFGFPGARAFGAATRWFAIAAVCLIIYHLQWVLLAYAMVNSPNSVLIVGAFLNLFVVVAAVCAIMGFIRLTSTR